MIELARPSRVEAAMIKLMPLLPFAAALSLLACRNDPIADDAAAPPDNLVGDVSARGLAAPANSAAAESLDRAALPPMSAGMSWTISADRRAAHFGPTVAEPQLTLGCAPGGLLVTRHHPANIGASGTLSLTGGGHVSSLPVAAVAITRGPGQAEWQGHASGDIARGVARPFSRPGPVELSLGGAPSLVVPADPRVSALLDICLSG